MRVDYGKYADKVKFWKEVIENVKEFVGTSPPSTFVGRAFYPKVFVGILSPPQHKEFAEILDSPEIWYNQKATIGEILSFRGQMIYSRFKSSVFRPSGKFIDIVQELSMSKKPADVEIELKKKPKFEFSFDSWTTPIGNPAVLQKAKLAENPTVERKVEYVVSDTDLKAHQAVPELYMHGISVSQIQKIFSSGLLGTQLQRRIVPTRWSITAVDDIISKRLASEISTFNFIDEIRLFHNEYLGNHYEILLIPGAYQYELVEVWNSNLQAPNFSSDYEKYWLRDSYASNTHGAFYSGRLGVTEYLHKIHRQASILIVREILPTYDMPMGIWQLRETVRDAFNKNFERFDSIEDAIGRISERIISGRKWFSRSKLLKETKQQKNLFQFKK